MVTGILRSGQRDREMLFSPTSGPAERDPVQASPHREQNLPEGEFAAVCRDYGLEQTRGVPVETIRLRGGTRLAVSNFPRGVKNN